jgi:hypothetical protein
MLADFLLLSDLLSGNLRLPAGNARGVDIMKNPLDSLGQTVILGLVLTVIVAVLIPIIG